jgi:regulator of sigma E protease
MDVKAKLDAAPAPEGEAVGQVGKLGAALNQAVQTEIVRYPLVQAGARADQVWSTSALSLKLLGKMLVGQASLQNLSGPLTVADYAGRAANMGWQPFISFLALVSVSLGVLNLLPIPVLDGGICCIIAWNFDWQACTRPLASDAAEGRHRVHLAPDLTRFVQ